MAKKKPRSETPTNQLFKKIEPAANDIPAHYINSATLDVSTFDVRFRMCQILGLEGDVLKVKEVTYIYMSHAHFKAFADLINKNMAKVDAMQTPKAHRVEEETTH
jgi:hypothetical protein